MTGMTRATVAADLLIHADRREEDGWHKSVLLMRAASEMLTNAKGLPSNYQIVLPDGRTVKVEEASLADLQTAVIGMINVLEQIDEQAAATAKAIQCFRDGKFPEPEPDEEDRVRDNHLARVRKIETALGWGNSRESEEIVELRLDGIEAHLGLETLKEEDEARLARIEDHLRSRYDLGLR